MIKNVIKSPYPKDSIYLERLMTNTSKEGECIVWKGARRNKNSYGAIKYKDKVIDTHRLSYMLHKGEIPEGMVVMHSCDNKPCINPDHLFIGTYSDNAKDAYDKGRMKTPKFPKGLVSPHGSISVEKAKEIKEAILNAPKVKGRLLLIAEQFDVKYQLVKDIAGGRSYINI